MAATHAKFNWQASIYRDASCNNLNIHLLVASLKPALFSKNRQITYLSAGL